LVEEQCESTYLNFSLDKPDNDFPATNGHNCVVIRKLLNVSWNCLSVHASSSDLLVNFLSRSTHVKDRTILRRVFGRKLLLIIAVWSSHMNCDL